MFRNATLFLALFSSFSLQANSDTNPVPSLSFLEKAGIQIINANIKQIPKTLAISTLGTLGGYYISSKITKNPLLRAATSLAAGITAYKIFNYYSWVNGMIFIPGTLFNTHPYRLARDWNKYLKMDVSEKNALLDESYPEFLKKLYTNAEFYDHPLRESNKLFWLEDELKEVAKMNVIEQKWHMLKIKNFAREMVIAATSKHS